MRNAAAVIDWFIPGMPARSVIWHGLGMGTP
jgi:hypothetical protein